MKAMTPPSRARGLIWPLTSGQLSLCAQRARQNSPDPFDAHRPFELETSFWGEHEQERTTTGRTDEGSRP